MNNYLKFSVSFIGLLVLLPAVVNAQVKYEPSLKVINENLSTSTFDIQYNQKNGEVSRPYLVDVAIRTPQKGNEIPSFNQRSPQGLNIICFPFFSYVTIKKVKLIEIKNLPPGLKAITNAKNLTMKANEVGGLRLYGNPAQRGHYSLVIKAAAEATYLGIPMPTSYCDITGAYIDVE